MPTQDIINNTAVIATFLAAIAALLTAIITFRIANATQASLEEARKNSLLTLLSRLDEELRPHEDVALKLRPGGVWFNGIDSPKSPQDWLAIESYMGSFERIQFLIEQKIIDIDTVDKMYGYRLSNIVMNPTIFEEKLVLRGRAWSSFIELWKALADHRKKSKSQDTLSIQYAVLLSRTKQ